jgi:hypothetical protein
MSDDDDENRNLLVDTIDLPLNNDRVMQVVEEQRQFMEDLVPIIEERQLKLAKLYESLHDRKLYSNKHLENQAKRFAVRQQLFTNEELREFMHNLKAVFNCK